MDDEIVVHNSSPDKSPFPIEDDQTIISLCNPATGNTKRLNDGVLVKYRNVKIEECRNQVEAHRLLDPKIVIVPKVYRYFSKGSEYYLVMEFMEGTYRDKVEDDESISWIAQIVRHFQTHESEVPGPLGGGISRGLFWEREHPPTELRTKLRLEIYINSKILKPERTFLFEVGKLVLNHNDIAPRNIIWMPDGSICFIDWEHAGYYPRVLETGILWINLNQGKDKEFASKLRSELQPMTVREKRDLELFSLAYEYGWRYHQKSLDELERLTELNNWFVLSTSARLIGAITFHIQNC